MRWEYQTLKFEPGGFLSVKVDGNQLQRALNQLGQEGWELCSSFDTNYGNGRSAEVVMVFKRPIGEALPA